MSFRPVIVLALLLGMTAGSAAQGSESLAADAIHGVVVSADGRPVRNARIELIDGIGRGVAFTHSGPTGEFRLPPVPRGTYQIVATEGLRETTARVDGGGLLPVELRLPGTGTPPAPPAGQHTVSVAQLKVPGKARKALERARKAIQKDELDQATEHLNQALALHPKYAEALTLRGILKLDSQQAEAARQDLEASIEADPYFTMGYFALGAAYNNLRRYDDAIRTLEAGLALEPTSWQGYFELGKAMLGKVQPEKALRHLDRAFQLAPQDFPLLHLVKGHTLLALENYAEAMVELQIYLQKQPAGPNSASARKMLEQAKAFASK